MTSKAISASASMNRCSSMIGCLDSLGKKLLSVLKNRVSFGLDNTSGKIPKSPQNRSKPVYSMHALSFA